MPLEFIPDCHRYLLDGNDIVSVTRALKLGGIIDDRWFTNFSRDRGSAVHKTCELDDLGLLDESSVDARIVPYLDAWRLFRRDHECEWIAIEEQVYCSWHRYAGCLDRRGPVDGMESIIDIKTGQSHPATALQLAAYAGTFGPLAAYQRIAVHLRKDGTYGIAFYKLEAYIRDLEVFRSILNVLRWRGEIE